MISNVIRANNTKYSKQIIKSQFQFCRSFKESEYKTIKHQKKNTK